MMDVFVSYSRSQRRHAEPIASKLEQLGLDIFFDIEGIDGGADFPNVIDRALRSCKAVLACWSPEYFQRKWCMIESRIGLEGRSLVPVAIKRFSKSDPPADMRFLNYFDLSDWRGADAHEGWNLTLQTLGKLVGRELAPPIKRKFWGGIKIDNTGVSMPASVTERADLLSDLRATWEKFPARQDRSAVRDILERVRRGAPGSGLEFEIEYHLKKLEPDVPVTGAQNSPMVATNGAKRVTSLSPWHVVLLLDNSGSMLGSISQQINDSLDYLLAEMQMLSRGGSKPYFLLSVVTFGAEIGVSVERMSAGELEASQLKVRGDGGTCNVSAALRHARNVLVRNPGAASDFTPYVFLLVAGNPDDPETALRAASAVREVSLPSGKPTLVCGVVGDAADLSLYRQIASEPKLCVHLDSPERIVQFLPAIGTSVSALTKSELNQTIQSL